MIRLKMAIYMDFQIHLYPLMPFAFIKNLCRKVFVNFVNARLSVVPFNKSITIPTLELLIKDLYFSKFDECCL